MFISREASEISHNFLCISLFEISKFPSEYQNFPPNIKISREEASQIPHFFSP